MFDNFGQSIRECYQHAEACERKAARQNDPASRQDFPDTAKRWLKLARSYELTRRLTRPTLKPR